MLRAVFAVVALGVCVASSMSALVPVKKDDPRTVKFKAGKVIESRWLGEEPELFVLIRAQPYYDWYETLTGLKRGIVRVNPATDDRKAEPGDVPDFQNGKVYLAVLGGLASKDEQSVLTIKRVQCTPPKGWSESERGPRRNREQD